MLETLLIHLKAHCDDLFSVNSTVLLLEEYWQKIHEIVACLKPRKKAILQPQERTAQRHL